MCIYIIGIREDSASNCFSLLCPGRRTRGSSCRFCKLLFGGERIKICFCIFFYMLCFLAYPVVNMQYVQPYFPVADLHQWMVLFISFSSSFLIQPKP